MENDNTSPDVPEELQKVLSRLNQISGNIGTMAELDWTDQTLSIVGQIGNDPEAHDEKDLETMLELFDSQVDSVVVDQFDIGLNERSVGDGGFRYEFDVSSYISEQAYILRVPFDDELSGEPPERYKEYLEQKEEE